MIVCCSLQIYFQVVSLAMVGSFVSGDCVDWDLGMENGLILDEQITASSAYIFTPASFGRLNYNRSWCTHVDNEYLQIDLQSLHVICAVSTQGEEYPQGWVKKYTLKSSTDNIRWTDYKENGLVKIFDGNNDENTIKKNVLSNVLITRWLRFVVKDFKNVPCMRTEVYGVKQEPGKKHIASTGKKHWILIVVTVVSFILALMVTLFCYLVWRHRRRKRKMAFVAQKYAQEGPDCQFTHDVFVSYSSKDYDWVKDNLQPLFDGSNIEYIIHSRDFIPGKSFFDNMADSVYSSRKVIFVMSRNYLSSGFCKDEMDMALFRAARNDENRSLIVVKIDDVKPQDIPKSLRDKTFIDYTSKGEATTWKKRILEFVSIANRSLSASTVEELVDTLDTKSLVPSKFTLKRKKEQLSGLLTKVCCKTKVYPACQQSLS